MRAWWGTRKIPHAFIFPSTTRAQLISYYLSWYSRKNSPTGAACNDLENEDGGSELQKQQRKENSSPPPVNRAIVAPFISIFQKKKR